MIELGRARQLFDFDALLHQGHVLVRPVVPNAQVLLAVLEHDLDWLQSKALLRHALNASHVDASRRIRDLLDSFGEDVETFSNARRLSLTWNNKRELQVQVELIEDAKARGPTRGKSAQPVRHPCFQKESIYLLAGRKRSVQFSGMFVVGELGLGFSCPLMILAFA